MFYRGVAFPQRLPLSDIYDMMYVVYDKLRNCFKQV